METTLTDRVLGGRYEVGPLLGRGGMADVYDAVDNRLGRPVAVKVLRAAMAARPEVRRRFEDEGRAAARLSHPNVVAVYDTGEDAGIPWIVMERLGGETLASRMVPGRPLDTDWVVRMAGDVLGALTAAHAAGVIHRDVKPGNILISDEGCAKVTDFGIAKSVEAVGDATTAGMLLGTPRYLSPERVEGRPSTASSDIYALGVVLYECLTGRRAYEGDTPVSVAYAVQHHEPTPLRQLRPDLPAPLVALVETAMARNPSQRFGTAREMAEALAAVPVADDTVGIALPPHAADATVAVARDTYAAGSPDPTNVAAAAPRAGGSARRRRGLDPRTIVVLAVAGIILILLAALAIGNGGGAPGAGSNTATQDGQTAHPASAKVRDAAARLADGDGARGAEASRRLTAIADKLDRGDEAGDDATALLRDGTKWRADRQLGTTAYDTLKNALLGVPGVDAAAANQPAPAAGVSVNVGDGKGEDDGDGEGKAKGKKGDD